MCCESIAEQDLTSRSCRQHMLQNPHKAISDLKGVEVPANFELSVHEDVAECHGEYSLSDADDAQQPIVRYQQRRPVVARLARLVARLELEIRKYKRSLS